MSLVGRYWVLPAFERRLVREAFLTLLRVRLQLRWHAGRTLANARAATPRGLPRGDPVEIGRAVRRASPVVPGSRCLPQALAAHRMLLRRGHPAKIHIGARRGAVFEAHAWTELEGRLILGDLPDLADYQRLD